MDTFFGQNKNEKKVPFSSGLFSSPVDVADAAKSTLNNLSDKVDTTKLAHSAGDLLGAASRHGKPEEEKLGQHVDTTSVQNVTAAAPRDADPILAHPIASVVLGDPGFANPAFDAVAAKIGIPGLAARIGAPTHALTPVRKK